MLRARAAPADGWREVVRIFVEFFNQHYDEVYRPAPPAASASSSRGPVRRGPPPSSVSISPSFEPGHSSNLIQGRSLGLDGAADYDGDEELSASASDSTDPSPERDLAAPATQDLAAEGGQPISIQDAEEEFAKGETQIAEKDEQEDTKEGKSDEMDQN